MKQIIESLHYSKGTEPHNQGQVYGDDGKTVAFTFDDEGGTMARIFAAAPLLLEALRAVTEALGHIDDYGTASGGYHPDIQNNALDMAEKAIAAAQQ